MTGAVRKKRARDHAATNAGGHPAAPVLLALALASMTFFVFWPPSDCQFTNHDDPFYVTGNPHVREGLSASGIIWAFTTFDRSNWHPLTWISLQLDYQVYGLNAEGFRITNVVLHAANTILLFLYLWRMTRALTGSAIVAALFAVHPLHVESVAWVSERKDVLSTLFWMLTIGAYLRYVAKPCVRRFAIVAALFVLGLMSKPMLVTLPLVLLLLDSWPLERTKHGTTWRRLLAEKAPLMALAAGSCIVTVLAQSHGGAVRALDDLPLLGRFGNAAVSYLTYLRQMIWPRDLAAFYPYEERAWSDIRVWGSCLALVAIAALVFHKRTYRPLLVGWLWYLVTLVPVIGFVQVGEQAHADRYTYVPSIGIFIAVVWLVGELASRSAVCRRAARCGATIALIACIMISSVQVGYWHDSVALWKHAIAVTGPNARAHFNLGAAYRDGQKLEAAAEEFRRSSAIDPGDIATHSNLGWCLFYLGKPDEARNEFRQVLAIDPDDANAHFQLGVIAGLGGQTDEAIAQYDETLRLRPEDVRAHVNLAIELLKRGDALAARRHLKDAELSDPRIASMPDFQALVKRANETAK